MVISNEILVPIVTAFVGGVVALVQDWVHKRDHDARRKAALAEAGKRVQFLDAWLKAQEAVSAPEDLERHKRRVREELDAIYARWCSCEGEMPPVRLSLSRVFLLYRPRSTGAWIAHIAFYAFTVTALLATLGLLLDLKNTMKDVPGTIAGVLVLVIGFASLRAWAMSFRASTAPRAAMA